jgi:amino acid adenylation domain-containing protein/non-ribosomal peptide synthase protein (TIGR01720 family)
MNRSFSGDTAIAASHYTRERDYWLKKLSGDLVKASFPTDYKKIAAERIIDTAKFKFSQEVFTRLIKISSGSDAKLFVLLVTGLILLLNKYTYSQYQDVIVGTPVLKQDLEGDFINTVLALRSRLNPHWTFKELLSQVKQTIYEANENQNYPIDTLLYKLNISSSESEDFPLFDIAVLLENIHDRKYLRGLNLNMIFSFFKSEESIEGVVEYNSLLYDKASIERITIHFNSLLQKVLSDVNREIYKIDPLTEEERNQLIDFNDTRADHIKAKTIHELFERQVKKSPANIAISERDTNRFISYKELNIKANRLAQILKENGVKPGSIVAILLERSMELIIAILGVLKTGAAYLPIDTDYPGNRKKYILEDSGTTLLITQKTLPDHYQGENNIIVLYIEDFDLASTETPGAKNSKSQGEPGDLAYIIYTSGSTGKPKGAMIEHQGLLNYACWAAKYYVKNEKLHFPFYTSISFDLTVTSIFIPLITGNTILVYGVEDNKSLIEKIVDDNRVEVVKLTPSHLNLIREKKIGKSYLNIRRLIVGGEDLESSLARDINEIFNGKVEIYNEYGPTETVVGCMIYKFDPGKDNRKSVPIGIPIDNTHIYILSRIQSLLPPGSKGEIFISGKGVARGYLNRPELTSQKFSENLFITGERMYKTGDLGGWLTDKNIEFLGRLDQQQVKIRGYRLELGEIENNLLNHPGIKNAVVLAKEMETGDKYLCAYLVSDKEITDSELKKYLSHHLPDYMIPLFFKYLETIPLTINGKVDRKALQKLDLETETKYEAPGNKKEQLLAKIWQDVLGLDRIGLNDNFFMLGGDSIKTIQITSRLNKEGYKVEMRDIFLYPTISKLSPFLRKTGRIPDQSIIQGNVPLTPIQRWFFKNKLADSHHFNHAVMLYSGEGLEEKAVKAVFGKIHQHHDALRMIYKEENGEMIQINQGLESPLSLEVHDLRNQENAKEILEQIANRIQASIDLENGPLMKLGLFHLDDGDRLLIVIHHLAIDGVSWRILFEDIETLYRQYKNRENFKLPLKSDSFKLWSEKLSVYANSELFLKETTYWAKIESTAIPIIKRDFEEEENYLIDTDRLSFSLSEEETKNLLTKVNYPFGTEINDILLTALGLGLNKVYGNKQMLIALEGHGREGILEDININRTIGWFTSLIPVILDFSFAADLSRQIKEVKECLNQVPHKGIGYGILKYLTAGDHKKEIEFKLTPQICFNYLGQIDEDLNSVSFEIAKESPGNTQSMRQKRDYDLDVSGIIVNKQLLITIVYNKKQYKSETMAAILDHYKKELSRIISYCSAREKLELTPSDLTYKELSIETVDQLNQQYQYTLEDIYTLSPMQEGMLFHALLDYSSPAYFEQVAYGFLGEMDASLMEKSLNELFKRYDILRSVFVHEYDGIHRPIQLVLKERQVDFYNEDLRRLTDKAEREAFIKEFKQKDKAHLFDLSKDVLMRVSIFRTANAEYKFIWSFHHILMDGWCTGILISDFFEIYNSYLQHRPYQLPGVKPFSTYIQWLEQRDRETSKNYWYTYLYGYDEIASIPGKKITKNQEKVYKNESVSLSLDRLKTNALMELASRNHVTLNTIIQTVWGILLGRYNGKQDVVFGTVVSGRPPEVEDVESMVGLFINTIPVRISFEENSTLTFNRLLQKVQEEAIISEPHHYYPLAEIQAQSTLKQNLLDHIMIYENYPIGKQIEELTGRNHPDEAAIHLELSDIDVFEQTNYDFNIVAAPGEQLTIHLDYNGNVYQRDWVLRISKHLNKLFQQIIDRNNEELEIEAITLITEEEKEQILTEFNQPKVEYREIKTIQALFEEQVEKASDKVAVAAMSLNTGYKNKWQQLTYRDLNEKANHLGRILKEKGVTVDTILPIMVDRSVEVMVGIMAILKAGGAYLPISNEYPHQRIKYILKDSQAKLLLTTHDCLNRTEVLLKNSLPEYISFIFIDDEGIGSKEASNIRMMNKPENLAYVIYTSGSTGKPKGVMVERRNLNNLVLGLDERIYRHYTGDTGQIVLCLVAPLIFDASVKQLFGALLLGHRLCIVPEDISIDGAGLSKFYQRYLIDISDGTPAHLRLLSESMKDDKAEIGVKFVLPVKHFLIGGEALSQQIVEEFFCLFVTKNNDLKITNVYGPTECCVDSSSYEISKENPGSYGFIPIGTPMPNQQIYILDERLKLQPIGIAGELCIGGGSVARGYFNDQELTIRKFIKLEVKVEVEEGKVPGEQTQNKHIYRTGDLARWLSDGKIEFLGRIDQQVKIRGFRIEAGEIESQLRTHDQIKEAVVITKKDANGDNYLCAYIVPLPSHSLNTDDLREYLSARLPDYMIPSFFMSLEKIPLTPSGKVDRRALPNPEFEAREAYAAPRNRIEEKLAEIWSDILGRGRDALPGTIGIDDNFFALGGHSLKATILVSKIHKTFNVRVPLADVFKTPSIRGLSEYIKGAGEDKYAAIKSVEKKDYYVLSSSQMRLYILQQMDLQGIGYNIPQFTEIKGEPERKKLEEVFLKLIRRHESLQTSFVMIDQQPVQRIQESVYFKIEYYDLTTGSANKQLAASIIEGFVRPFDLSQAPLLRVGLMKLPHPPTALHGHPRWGTYDSQEEKGDKYLLMVDMHHIISDAVSSDILAREFISLNSGEELTPLKLHLTYKDYVQWQNSEEQKTLIKHQEAYWLKEFSSELPVLNLPTDYPRPLMQSFEGYTVTFVLSEKETQILKELAKETDATLYMSILAVFNILLAKLSGQEDIIVGTPCAGRRHADFERIIGMFVNTLALRNYPLGDKRVNEFLGEVKKQAIEAFENQEYQFEGLVDKASVPRDTSRNPIFDVMFNLWNQEDNHGEIPGINEESSSSFVHKKSTSKFDLTLTAIDFGQRLFFSLEYCSKLFKSDTIERIITYFKKILFSISGDTGQKLSEIEIITGLEKQQILYDFNDTKVEYPHNKIIHELFEEQAARTPDRIALVGSNTALTYWELNERVNRLARTLIEKGVQPDDIVGIMVERSIEMIVAIFAILKAGGAYLPIDLHYPAERMVYMLKDSSAGLLLTTRELFEEGNCTKIKRWEGKTCFIEDPHELAPGSRQPAANLAYIIYTSGSTGDPKGVMVEQASVMNMLYTLSDLYPFSENDVYLMKTSYLFDVSVTEIFGWFLGGGRLVLLEKEGEKDAQKIFNTIERKAVTHINFVPSMFGVFVDFVGLEGIDGLPGLKYIFLAGEALPPEMVRRFKAQNSNVLLENIYGPTEATIYASKYSLQHWEGDSDKQVPIGRPLDNIELYVVDKGNHLQPVGVLGELCIAGAGIARGYLNQPELTAEKFIEFEVKVEEGIYHRFCRPYPSYIIYRTGDLAKWQPDGNILFIGRMDQQVKIRGFRIELGEIESQLHRHNNIKEAVVTAKNDANGGNYLCAYVVPYASNANANTLNDTELRKYLSTRLPDYMIPSFFVSLEMMPLTPSGKVDRKALSGPKLEAGEAYVAPRNWIEEKLTEIWSDVLGIEKTIISVEANFFELGGHSLKAIILVTKIHKAFNVKVPLSEIFRTPRISGVYQYIKKAGEDKYAAIAPIEKKDYYVVSSAQRRLYILQQMDLDNTGYNMLHIISLKDETDREKLEKTFLQLIERHESLRTSFRMVKDQPVQKVYEPHELEFKIVHYQQEESDAGEIETANKIQNSFVRSFDLSRGPLLRVGLVKTLDSRYILLVDMHHIISDAMSIDILTREFTLLYSGEELPSLRLQYKDYTQWQNLREQKKLIKQQELYWIKEFSHELPVLNFATDYQRPLMQSFEGNTVYFVSSEKETRILKEMAKESDATLFMSILTVFNILLSKLGGQEDIIVGIPIAGRRHEDLERIIGMFVNTLGLRNYPSRDKTVKTFLREVKGRAIEALENQEYPFEDLVDRVSVGRDTSRNPIFDVMFNMLSQEEYNGEIPGIDGENSSSYVHKRSTSKFDLTLTAVDFGQRLFFSIEYCSKLFKSGTIERIIAFFKKILFSLSENTGQKLSGIEIITGLEKQKILFDFNDTKVEYPGNKLIHELFEEQAARIPDHTAVIGTASSLGKPSGERTALTYREFNEKSNRLARVLREKGITPGTTAAIMEERSLEMTIGIFAILKAGGAYLPIEPDNPRKRIKYILEDSAVKLLLTGKGFFPGLEDGVQLVDLENLELYMEGKDNIKTNGSPNDLAYVLYTSGSTGSPKGVVVEHRSVVNILFTLFEEYPFSQKDVYLMKTSYLFDVSVSELFGWFLGGGRLGLLEKEGEKDPRKILNAIECECVSHINFVPSMFGAFVDFMDIQSINSLASLKYIFLAGEALPAEMVNKFRKRNNMILLENIYGPTEAAIYASKYSLRHWNGTNCIPIGRPLNNILLYIVDKGNHLQPIGIQGELCISGVGLARGYLNRPELTAEKFDHDLWDYLDYHDEKKIPGKRIYSHRSSRSYPSYTIYKTGDLARWTGEGDIEFFGRMDQQVKIRGFRIELGEIESQLQKHPGIKEAVVLSKDEDSENKHLVAYVVPIKIDSAGTHGEPGELSDSSRDNFDLNTLELREYLLKKLPYYMVPSHFVELEAIPLTPSGKIDRKALELPGGTGLETGIEYVAPRNDLEEKLVEIWQNVLGRDAIGINDNFFVLGGDSIKSIQIVSRMNQAGYKIEMKDIFMTPVIALLAPKVKKLERKADQSLITGRVPLTPIQQEFFANSLEYPHHYNQAVMLYSKDGFEEEAVKAVFTKIQEHHDALRMTYLRDQGKIIQINHGVEYPLSLQVYDLRNLENAARAFEVNVNEIQKSIDLEKGPLMKLGLFHLEDGDRLLIVIHHLIIDGVSWRILSEDIEHLYQQYMKGEPLALPLKTDSFKIWSEKLSQYANSPSFLQEKRYWAELESLEVPGLMSDFNDDNCEKNTASLSFILSEEETDLLLTKVNESFGTEINDILLTALGLSIRKSCGNTRVLIALEGHGREEILKDINITRTVGWFTTVYPLILDVSYEDDLSRQIKDVKEKLHQVPDKGIGHGILKHLTAAEHKEDLQFKLKPRICFNYFGQFDAEIEQMSFGIARESSGNLRNPEELRQFELDISGVIANKRLVMSIAFSKNQFKEETIKTLLNHYERQLSRIISFCASQEKRQLTPSDFTYKELSIEDIGAINALFDN